VMCNGCGFIYHTPTLDHEEVLLMYKNFRDTSFRGETPDEYFDRITRIPKEDSFNYKKTLLLNDLMTKFLPEKKKRSLFDVGTGGGVFVKTFLDYADGGWKAFGVEPTPSYAELASRRLHIPVKTGFYEPRIYDTTFDLITANKVVEHSGDAIEFLKGFYQDLSDDGMVYIEVPNAKEIFTLPPLHDQLLYDHLYFFSDKVMEYVCDKASFEIVWKSEPQNEKGEIDLIVVLKKKTACSLQKEFTFPLQRPEDIIPLATRNSAN
jgi:SAM-dependent methyltransferase